MTRTPTRRRFRYALAATLLAVAAPAAATESTGPASTVSAGIGYVTPDNQRFGEYTGLDTEGTYGLLDLDLNRLDPETGTWLRLEGRDLGLDSRELRLRGARQGDWGYALEYSRVPRTFPYAVNTALAGAGTAALTTTTISPGGGTPLQLATHREIVRARVDKVLPGNFDVNVTFRNEHKDGTRLYGRTGIDFLVDPIDYDTRQWEAVLSYTGRKLQVSGGYYGTTFADANTGLVVDGVTDGPNNVYSPIGLPPDNVSHELYLTGGYDISRATRADFKVSLGRVTQDDMFISTVTIAPGVGSNLDGKIDTTRVELGLTSRPTRRLSLGAQVRREDRDDRTPVLVYYSGASATSRTDGTNEPRDFTTTAGKLEAVYRPGAFRVTGAVTQEDTRRNDSAVRSVSARTWTRETAYRAELGRAMSGSVNGAVAYVLTLRDGSDFKTNVLNDASAGSNNIAPVHYADRREDKVRVALDATPSNRVSLQLVAETAWEGYDARTSQELGVKKAARRHVSADAAVHVARTWDVTAFVSHDRTAQRHNGCDGISSTGAACAAADLWNAELVNRGVAAGLGVRGQASRRVGVGADVQTSYDKGQFHQSGTPVTETVGDVYYRPLTVSGFADLALTRDSGVALSATYDRRRTNDWSWVGWTYADGTTLYQDPNEEVVFVGARYHRTWR